MMWRASLCAVFVLILLALPANALTEPRKLTRAYIDAIAENDRVSLSLYNETISPTEGLLRTEIGYASIYVMYVKAGEGTKLCRLVTDDKGKSAFVLPTEYRADNEAGMKGCTLFTFTFCNNITDGVLLAKCLRMEDAPGSGNMIQSISESAIRDCDGASSALVAARNSKGEGGKPYEPCCYASAQTGSQVCKSGPLTLGVDSALCFPLLVVAGLLMGGMFMMGRNPLAMFDLSSPRMGRGKQYQMRQKSKSFYLTGIAQQAFSKVASKVASKVSQRGAQKTFANKKAAADKKVTDAAAERKAAKKDVHGMLIDARKSGKGLDLKAYAEKETGLNKARANLRAARIEQMAFAAMQPSGYSRTAAQGQERSREQAKEAARGGGGFGSALKGLGSTFNPMAGQKGGWFKSVTREFKSTLTGGGAGVQMRTAKGEIITGGGGARAEPVIGGLFGVLTGKKGAKEDLSSFLNVHRTVKVEGTTYYVPASVGKITVDGKNIMLTDRQGNRTQLFAQGGRLMDTSGAVYGHNQGQFIKSMWSRGFSEFKQNLGQQVAIISDITDVSKKLLGLEGYSISKKGLKTPRDRERAAAESEKAVQELMPKVAAGTVTVEEQKRLGGALKQKNAELGNAMSWGTGDLIAQIKKSDMDAKAKGELIAKVERGDYTAAIGAGGNVGATATALSLVKTEHDANATLAMIIDKKDLLSQRDGGILVNERMQAAVQAAEISRKTIIDLANPESEIAKNPEPLRVNAPVNYSFTVESVSAAVLNNEMSKEDAAKVLANAGEGLKSVVSGNADAAIEGATQLALMRSAAADLNRPDDAKLVSEKIADAAVINRRYGEEMAKLDERALGYLTSLDEEKRTEYETAYKTASERVANLDAVGENIKFEPAKYAKEFEKNYGAGGELAKRAAEELRQASIEYAKDPDANKEGYQRAAEQFNDAIEAGKYTKIDVGAGTKRLDGMAEAGMITKDDAEKVKTNLGRSSTEVKDAAAEYLRKPEDTKAKDNYEAAKAGYEQHEATAVNIYNPGYYESDDYKALAAKYEAAKSIAEPNTGVPQPARDAARDLYEVGKNASMENVFDAVKDLNQGAPTAAARLVDMEYGFRTREAGSEDEKKENDEMADKIKEIRERLSKETVAGAASESV